MKINLSLCFAAGLLGLVAGCETVSEPALPAEGEVIGHANPDPEKFAALDRTVLAAVQCTRLRERQLPDGRLEVAANLRNHASSALVIKVNCVYKDAQGLLIEDETPFQTITVAPGAIETVRFTAANPLATRYTVQVKRSR